MEFLNDTDCSGAIFRSELEPDIMYTSVLARLCYGLSEDGRLDRVFDEPNRTLIRHEPQSDAYGILEPDGFLPRTGTDLIVMGDAIAAEGATTSMDVRVTAGPYDLTLRVFGERVWESSLRHGPVPSQPELFSALPITLSNAYGGAASTQYGPLPFSRNPDGKGYYLSKQEAIGRPLPNVEDPRRLIYSWDDRPDPIGIGPYPSHWGLRLDPCVTVEPDTRRPRFTPNSSLHDRAHPRLSGHRLTEGEPVRIQGMSAGSDVEFVLPPCPLEVEIRLAEHVHVRSLWLEEILVDLRSRRVELTYRKVFHYEIKPFQLRRTRLLRRGPEAP